MHLCASCRSIKLQLLPDPDERVGPIEESAGFRHSTAKELLACSQTCSLCALIKTSFLRVGAYHTPDHLVDEHLRNKSSSLVLLRAGRKDAKRSSNGGANLNSIEVLVHDEKNWLRGQFHLYAPQGKMIQFFRDDANTDQCRQYRRSI